MTTEPDPAPRPVRYVTCFNTVQGLGKSVFHASPSSPRPVDRREGRYHAVCGQHVANITAHDFDRDTLDACRACLGILIGSGELD